MAPKDHSYDYVVIGAGAAGCVVAGRLATNAESRVVLVEAGGGDHHFITKVPGTAFLAGVSPKRNWGFETEPVPGLGGRRMRWNQGRLVGGSSSINGMIYMRGHSREYDQWRQLGCEGWAFEDVLPFFRKSESSERGASRWHGDSGPLHTRISNTSLPICEAFLNATAEAGFPVVDDLNADIAEGFGRYDINVRNGRRVSTATGYLPSVRRNKNFALITDSRALRILIDKGRAWGVELLRNGQTERIVADCEVIVCCGAINSPQLLMLSGVGPAAVLDAMGIEIKLDAPEIGRNLTNHPAYQLRFACSEAVTAYSYLRPHRAAAIGLRYALGLGGPLAESYVAQGGVFRTDPALEISDSIVVMAPALVTRGGTGQRWRDLLPDQHGFAVSVSHGRPASRGEIRLRSSNPLDPPLIQPNFLAEPTDMQAVRRAVCRVRDIIRQPSLRKLISNELEGDELSDDSTIEASIRANLSTYSHPMGTCRMGSDANAVVDARLRVRGIENLRVADASIIPMPLNACTHGPTIMIGEKAAEMIAEDRDAVVRSRHHTP